MVEFRIRLKELMEDNKKSKEDIAKILNMDYLSTIYDWLNGVSMPRFSSIIKIANYFNCSIDYLLGRTENYEEIKITKTPNFKLQLNQILEKKKLKKHNLTENHLFSAGHLYTISKNIYLSTENMIKLADYLGVSIDFLIGRV